MTNAVVKGAWVRESKIKLLRGKTAAAAAWQRKKMKVLLLHKIKMLFPNIFLKEGERKRSRGKIVVGKRKKLLLLPSG